jgi:hypothetical protein
MKKNVFIIIVLTALIVGMKTTAQQSKAATKETRVLVYYFHGTHRCPTCLAIEDNTRKMLDTHFTKEMKDGIIRFQSINLDEEANQKLAEAYEAAGSSLFVTRVEGKKKMKQDLTDFAFTNAKNNPEKFISELKKVIDRNLK